MAKRVFQGGSFSWTAVALGTPPASGSGMGIFCNATAATQYIDILECTVQGTASASAIFGGTLARCSAASATRTALASPASDGPQNPFSAALTNPPSTYTAATTMGTPSSAATDTKFPLVINAFGGLYRENFAPNQQFSIFGATTPFEECIIFNSTSAGGATTTAIAAYIYEPM